MNCYKNKNKKNNRMELKLDKLFFPKIFIFVKIISIFLFNILNYTQKN